jgi:predicted dehydrogenase
MKKLRVGIAGYGVVGKRRHQFIDQNPYFLVVGVCDQKFEGTGILRGEVHFYQDYKSLLANENLDALFVCLTNDMAREVTISGLNQNLHVFCEKPPGKNVEDIVMVRLVESLKPHLKLKYGFNHRYHESIKEALKIVESRALGTILNMRGIYGKSSITSPDSDWRSKREIAGGGILLDQGIHMVDLMRIFAGEFKEYYSFVENNFWNHDIEDNIYALMKTETGIVAFLHSTATEWRHRFNLEITLTRGSIFLNGILSGSKSYGQENLRVVFRGEENGGNPLEQLTTYLEDNSWRDEINEFAEAIVNNGKILNGSSFDALKSMEMVFDIYLADKEWSRKFNIEKSL